MKEIIPDYCDKELKMFRTKDFSEGLKFINEIKGNFSVSGF